MLRQHRVERRLAILQRRSLSVNLEKMKFGLTAYVRGSFTEEVIRPSGDGASLIFFSSKGQCGFKTAVRGFERSLHE